MSKEKINDNGWTTTIGRVNSQSQSSTITQVPPTVADFKKEQITKLGDNPFAALADFSDDTNYMKLVNIELVSYYLSSEIYERTDEWKSECNLIADSDLFKGHAPLSSLYRTTIAPETLAKLKIITLFRSMMQRLFPMINKPMVEKLQSIWIANAIGILINCVNNVQHRLNLRPVNSDGFVSITVKNPILYNVFPDSESKSSPAEIKKKEKAKVKHAKTDAYNEALEKFINFKNNVTLHIRELWLVYVCHNLKNPIQPDRLTDITKKLDESTNKNDCMKQALIFIFEIITEMFNAPSSVIESASKLTPGDVRNIIDKAKTKIGIKTDYVEIDSLLPLLETRRIELKLDTVSIAMFVQAYTSLLGDITIGTTDADVLHLAQYIERHFKHVNMLLNIKKFVDSMPLQAIMYACLAYTDTATSTVVADSKAPPPQTSINVLQHDITQFLNDIIKTDFYIGECIFSIIWADVLNIYGNLKNALQTEQTQKGLLFCDLRINKDKPDNIRAELTRLNMLEDAKKYVTEITGETTDITRMGGGNNNSKKIVKKIKKYTKKWKGRGGMFGLSEKITQVLINLPQLLTYTSNIPTEYVKYVAGAITVCITGLALSRKITIPTLFNALRNIAAIAAIGWGIYYTCYSPNTALDTFSANSLKQAGDFAGNIVTGTSYTTNIIVTQMNMLSITPQQQSDFVTMVKEYNDNYKGVKAPMPKINEYEKGSDEQKGIAEAAKAVHTTAIDGLIGTLNSRAQLAANVASVGNPITPSNVHNDMARNAIGLEFLRKPITEVAKDTKLNKMTDAFTKLQADGEKLQPKHLAPVGSKNPFNLNLLRHDATTVTDEYAALGEHRRQGGEVINILLTAFRLHKVSDMAGRTFKNVEEYIDTFRHVAGNQISTLPTIIHLDSFSGIASAITNKYGGLDETYTIPFTNVNDVIDASVKIGKQITQLNAANKFYPSGGVSDDIFRLVSDKINDIGGDYSVREPLLNVFKDPSTVGEYFTNSAKPGGIGIERAHKNLMYTLVSTANRFFDKGRTKDYNMPISTNLLSRTPAQQDAASCAVGVDKRGDSNIVSLYLNAVMSNTVISSSAKTIITNLISTSISKLVSEVVVAGADAAQAAAAAAGEPTSVAAAQVVKTIIPLINQIYTAVLAVDSAENALLIVSQLKALVTDAQAFLNFNQQQVGQLCSVSKATNLIDNFISDKMTREEFQLRMAQDNNALLVQFNDVITNIGKIIPQEQMRLQQQQQQQQQHDQQPEHMVSADDRASIAYKAGWGIFLFCVVSTLPKFYRVISSKYQSVTTLKSAFSSIPEFTFAAGIFAKSDDKRKENVVMNMLGGGGMVHKNKLKTRKIKKTNYYSKKTYKWRYNKNKINRCTKRYHHTKKRNIRKYN